MSEPVITISNLWKSYQIGKKTTSDTLVGSAKQIFTKKNKENFWALQEIDLTINAGDVVGIIGRNGAGKSTLLKILSRITWPTKGRIEIEGRLASLLEVGTGFHPELTGRENIYLNGTILGMSRKEVTAKFDEIVAFSDIEKFIDTPVKRYSSGMYVRLAFAVAAHLEPEILVVDEVLAVGDVEFQKKCLNKMGEVSGSGRTVLFVSHNMGAIANLCSSCLLLENGQVSFTGDTKEGIDKYLSQYKTPVKNKDLREIQRPYLNNSPVIITGFELRNSDLSPALELKFGEPFSFRINCEANQNTNGASVLIGISANNGQRVFTALSDEQDGVFLFEANRKQAVDVHFEAPMLLPGTYSVVVAIYRGKMGVLDMIEEVMMFDVMETTFEADIPPYKGNYGFIRVHPKWEISR